MHPFYYEWHDVRDDLRLTEDRALAWFGVDEAVALHNFSVDAKVFLYHMREHLLPVTEATHGDQSTGYHAAALFEAHHHDLECAPRWRLVPRPCLGRDRRRSRASRRTASAGQRGGSGMRGRSGVRGPQPEGHRTEGCFCYSAAAVGRPHVSGRLAAGPSPAASG